MAANCNVFRDAPQVQLREFSGTGFYRPAFVLLYAPSRCFAHRFLLRRQPRVYSATLASWQFRGVLWRDKLVTTCLIFVAPPRARRPVTVLFPFNGNFIFTASHLDPFFFLTIVSSPRAAAIVLILLAANCRYTTLLFLFVSIYRRRIKRFPRERRRATTGKRLRSNDSMYMCV